MYRGGGERMNAWDTFIIFLHFINLFYGILHIGCVGCVCLVGEAETSLIAFIVKKIQSRCKPTELIGERKRYSVSCYRLLIVQ